MRNISIYEVTNMPTIVRVFYQLWDDNSERLSWYDNSDGNLVSFIISDFLQVAVFAKYFSRLIFPFYSSSTVVLLLVLQVVVLQLLVLQADYWKLPGEQLRGIDFIAQGAIVESAIFIAHRWYMEWQGGEGISGCYGSLFPCRLSQFQRSGSTGVRG